MENNIKNIKNIEAKIERIFRGFDFETEVAAIELSKPDRYADVIIPNYGTLTDNEAYAYHYGMAWMKQLILEALMEKEPTEDEAKAFWDELVAGTAFVGQYPDKE